MKKPVVEITTVEEFVKLHGSPGPLLFPLLPPERVLGIERVCEKCGGSFKPEGFRLRHACECDGRKP